MFLYTVSDNIPFKRNDAYLFSVLEEPERQKKIPEKYKQYHHYYFVIIDSPHFLRQVKKIIIDILYGVI